jgi:predicted metal-dependent enzyme (double-stranded beta helix superfamily)
VERAVRFALAGSGHSVIETSELTTYDLRRLARELRADRSTWEPLVQHSSDRRHYELLRHDDTVMAWVISWMNDHDTGFHDHDVSSGAVAVARGSIREERLRLGADPVPQVYTTGDVFDFRASDIHRVAHEGATPAVTIHVYSPPLRRMGAYVVEPSGQLRRESLSYAEELRPLAA